MACASLYDGLLESRSPCGFKVAHAYITRVEIFTERTEGRLFTDSGDVGARNGAVTARGMRKSAKQGGGSLRLRATRSPGMLCGCQAREVDVGRKWHPAGVMLQDFLKWENSISKSAWSEARLHAGCLTDLDVCLRGVSQLERLVDTSRSNQSRVQRVLPVGCGDDEDPVHGGLAGRPNAVQLVQEGRENASVHATTRVFVAVAALVERALVCDCVELVEEEKTRGGFACSCCLPRAAKPHQLIS